jgi:hypothetical protein
MSVGVPGLVYLKQFISPAQSLSLTQACLALNRRCNAVAAEKGTSAAAFIPQPMHVRSSHHNLRSEESYVPLVIKDDVGEAALRCEHFARYGEEGHELTYFRGTANIPASIGNAVIPLVQEKVAPVKDLLQAKKDLNWKLTLNIYKVQTLQLEPTLAGFPFHVDIPSNGVITMILSLIQGAQIQLVKDDKEDDVRSLFMEPDSLLVLSGESRYRWRHRVLPSVSSHSGAHGEVGRISVVLGCQ